MTFRPVLLTVRLLTAATLLLVCVRTAPLRGQELSGLTEPDIATDDIQQPIRIRADVEEKLISGETDIHLLIGRVRLDQGGLSIHAEKMAVVSDEKDGSFDVRVYGENVVLRNSDNQKNLAMHVLRLQSLRAPEFIAGSSRTVETSHDPLFSRAAERLFPGQFQSRRHVALQVTPDSFLPSLSSGLEGLASQGTRRIQVRPRSSQPLRFESSESTDTVPPEQVYEIGRAHV